MFIFLINIFKDLNLNFRVLIAASYDYNLYQLFVNFKIKYFFQIFEFKVLNFIFQFLFVKD